MSTMLFEHQEDELVQRIAAHETCIVLCDAKTNGFCLPVLRNQIPNLPFTSIIVIPDGEENKNLEVMQYLWSELTRLNASRNTLLLNIGGGVLCDMGGFAASTFKRGIPYINIPTTLTAMIDASIGGKTGIDWMGFKNLLGHFYLPEAIYVHPKFLRTLSERHLQSGMVEMWKHALISGADAWAAIQTASLEELCTTTWLQQSIAVKVDCITRDPLDLKERQALNLGHTIGHAIEAFALEKKVSLLHGEAVLFGLLAECRLAEKLLALDPSVRQQLFMLKNKFMHGLHPFWTMKGVIPFLIQDKKNTQGIRMSLLRAPGDVSIQHEVSMDDIMKLDPYADD